MRRHDDGEIEITRKEMDAIIWLFAACGRLDAMLPDLKELAGHIGDKFPAMEAASDELGRDLLAIVEALPEKARRHIGGVLHGDELTLRPRHVGRSNTSFTISKEDLAVLEIYARRSECSICMLSGKEVRQCPLRQTLLSISPPESFSPYRCEYADD